MVRGLINLGLFPTHIHVYSIRLGTEEDAVWTVRLVLLCLAPVIKDRGLLVRSGRNGVGEVTQRCDHGVPTPFAQLH